MIKSMTGFASLTRDEESATLGVTIRAVNHRFLDRSAAHTLVAGIDRAAVAGIVQQQGGAPRG
jgi:hypothetical protein